MSFFNRWKNRKRRWALVLAGAFLLASVFLLARSHYQPPVLMYHFVGHPSDTTSLNVSPETFEKQMEFLKVHHYRVLPLETYLAYLRDGGSVPPKSVMITFDDGTEDLFKHAYPVLKRMGFPATVFMITEKIGEAGWLSADQLRAMHAAGIRIGSHTAHHAYLPDLETAAMRREIEHSKQTLEKILGVPVRLFSYPAGGFNEEAKALVKQAGYEGAVTTNRGRERRNPYALRRVKATEGKKNLFNFWAKTSGFYHVGKSKRNPY